MNFVEIYKQGRYADAFILLRHSYRMGEPFISKDSFYDELEDCFKAYRNADNDKYSEIYPFLDRTYDDDPVPVSLLKEINRLDLVPNMIINSPYASMLNSSKSLSIHAVNTSDDVWDFIKSHNWCDLIISKKGDGANSKSGYVNGRFELGLSRGRKGNCLDYTKNIAKVLPSKIDTQNNFITIFSESFVTPSGLEILRGVYPSKFATAKSGAISMLRVSYPQEYYKYLKSPAFDIKGIPDLKTVEDKYLKLKELGFETMPYKVIKGSEIPRDRSAFESWLEIIMLDMYDDTPEIPSDGMVMEVNDLNLDMSVNNQYSSRNIALKFGPWKFPMHHGKITDIIIEQQRVVASCRIKIEPMKTFDGCTATFINGYNPKILMEEGLIVGSEVAFERDSGAINKLHRGGKK